MLLTWLAWQCMLAIAEYALAYLLLHKLWSIVSHMNIFWVEIVTFQCSNNISLNGVQSSHASAPLMQNTTVKSLRIIFLKNRVGGP